MSTVGYGKEPQEINAETSGNGEKHAGIWYFLFCIFAGVIVGIIVWGYQRISIVGKQLIWEYLPAKLNFPGYTLTLCLVGGLLVGVFQNRFGVYPEDMSTVVGKVKKDHFYPYNNMPVLIAAAVFPVLMGASVGPEAGLVGIVIALSYWVGDRRKRLRLSRDEIAQIGMSAVLGAIFIAPLFGLAEPVEERTDDRIRDKIQEKEDESTILRKREGGKRDLPRPSTVIANILTVAAAVSVMVFFRRHFGGRAGIPRVNAPDITNRERFWGFLLAFVGSAFGYLFIYIRKAAAAFFSKLQKKNCVLSAGLGGLALGIIGTILPITMFPGQEGMAQLGETYRSYAPWLLLVIGTVKLLLTNLCIQSGLRGGHLFPVIFSGVSIGYGMALLTGLNPAFTVAVITAAILGVIMRKPLAVTFLLLMCFPVRIIPWLLIASFIGSLMPWEKPPKRRRRRGAV